MQDLSIHEVPTVPMRIPRAHRAKRIARAALIDVALFLSLAGGASAISYAAHGKAPCAQKAR